MSLDAILQFISANSEYALVLIFIFAFCDSLVVVGSILSSAILFSICVFLYNNGILNLNSIVPIAVIGAHIGDTISFYIGKKSGDIFLNMTFIKKRQHIIEKANRFIKRFGPYTVVIGRWVPAIRPVVPFLLGISEMKFLNFYKAAVLAVLTWGVGLIILTTGLSSIL